MCNDDILYTDSRIDQIATYRITPDFMKMSERFRTSPIFRGLKMDHTGTIRDDTRASPSFTDLRKALLSTDDAAYQAYRTKWLADG